MIQRFYNTRYFEGPDVEIGARKQASFDALLSWAHGQERVPEIPWVSGLIKPHQRWQLINTLDTRLPFLYSGFNFSAERLAPR